MSGMERDQRMKQRALLKFWPCHFCLENSTFPVAYGIEYICRWPSGTAQFPLALFISTSNRNVQPPFRSNARSFLPFRYFIILFTSPRMPFPSILVMENRPTFQEPSLSLWLKLKVGFLSSLKAHTPTACTIHSGFRSCHVVDQNWLPCAWPVRSQELYLTLCLSTASIKTSSVSKAFDGPEMNWFFVSSFLYCKPISQLPVALNVGGEWKFQLWADNVRICKEPLVKSPTKFVMTLEQFFSLNYLVLLGVDYSNHAYEDGGGLQLPQPVSAPTSVALWDCPTPQQTLLWWRASRTNSESTTQKRTQGNSKESGRAH